MQIGEAIAPPVVHSEPDENCPFCPPPEPATYKTYPGSANNSSHLAAIMEEPSKLTSLQSGARPQTGKCDSAGHAQEQSAPQAREKDDGCSYTFQAHHLISGNQALKGSPMEKWIQASDRNDKDTGYSVNCTANGFWAPSVPKEYVGRWGASKGVLTGADRQRLAEEVMSAANAQIHIGPHNISDPDDPQGKLHKSYDQYIKEYLRRMSDRIHLHGNECFLCAEAKSSGKKPQATHVVHDMLDRFSSHLQKKITGPRTTWRIFISKYAMEYHKQVCSCAGTYL